MTEHNDTVQTLYFIKDNHNRWFKVAQPIYDLWGGGKNQIDTATFERLEQLLNDYDNCMNNRMFSMDTEKQFIEECNQHSRDIETLRALVVLTGMTKSLDNW